MAAAALEQLLRPGPEARVRLECVGRDQSFVSHTLILDIYYNKMNYNELFLVLLYNEPGLVRTSAIIIKPDGCREDVCHLSNV